MSAESSSASGNLSKETPANGTHRDCRSRQRYDYNGTLPSHGSVGKIISKMEHINGG